MYSASEETDALLLPATLNTEKSDKKNVRVVGMGDGSLELDTQIEFKEHLAFLVEDLFLDNGIDKKTDWEAYFPFIPICSSEKSEINTIKIDHLLNQKRCH